MGIRHLKPGKFLPSPGIIEINLRGSSNTKQQDEPQEEPKQQKEEKESDKMSTPKKSKATLNKNNSTGYNGVSTTKNGKFGVQITVTNSKGKKKTTFKRFEKALDAAMYYDEQMVKLHGSDYPRLNFPGKKAAASKASSPASPGTSQ